VVSKVTFLVFRGAIAQSPLLDPPLHTPMLEKNRS